MTGVSGSGNSSSKTTVEPVIGEDGRLSHLISVPVSPLLPLDGLFAITSTLTDAFAAWLSTDVTVITALPIFFGVIRPVSETTATVSSLDE